MTTTETAQLDIPLSDYRAAGLTPEDLRQMYWLVTLGRTLDQRSLLLYRQGRAPFILSCAGHEVAQVAATWPLIPGKDWISPYYRDVVACFRMGYTAYDVMLSVLAKRDDPASGATQTPGHFSSRKLHIISGGSPVATQVVHGVGAAYAMKLRREDTVMMTMFGDGATAQGDMHEAMNFASIHKLPVIFFCENNGYAISVPLSKQMAIKHFAERAKGYAMPGYTVDGHDPVAVYRVAREAVERARAGEGPTVIEALVDRLSPHSSEDDPRRYRDPAELAELAKRDCVPIFRRQLIAWGVMTEDELNAMDRKAQEEVDEATRRAAQARDARPEEATLHIYGARQGGERWLS
jgi:2-oxoisovalerate dehydrogenase E1 component alpha subunit